MKSRFWYGSIYVIPGLAPGFEAVYDFTLTAVALLSEPSTTLELE